MSKGKFCLWQVYRAPLGLIVIPASDTPQRGSFWTWDGIPTVAKKDDLKCDITNHNHRRKKLLNYFPRSRWTPFTISSSWASSLASSASSLGKPTSTMGLKLYLSKRMIYASTIIIITKSVSFMFI